MNRKTPLLMAVFAMLSLSACHKSMPLQPCSEGDQKGKTKPCDEAEITCHNSKEVLMTCLNNAWVETPCSGSTPICAFGRCVECLTHDERLNNDVAEVCAANVWHKKQTEP